MTSVGRARGPRWARKLKRELAHGKRFEHFCRKDWTSYLQGKRVTSLNHDTYLAIDWPHYCYAATTACGGVAGWCYTFQGHQAARHHDSHVAMTDCLARMEPQLFCETVVAEVLQSVASHHLPYPNLRYSGSGECTDEHLPSLKLVADAGIRLWGFTRQLSLALSLRKLGAAALFSCDSTTDKRILAEAVSAGVGLAYTSCGVDDIPPHGSFVVFPVHRGGRVTEVVESDVLCPKVLDDFFHEKRPPRSCQIRCQRCHQLTAQVS